MKLPQADWQKRPGLSALIAALNGASKNEGPRYVGGAVRDTLLGLDVKDVDIATPLLPDIVMERLKAADIRVIPTGIDHGTVTAVLPDGPVEITTLRRDVSTDGRRATVAFSDDWQEDAARRDFTINALFADPGTLEVTDYFGGMNDLKTRRIRFIGSAAERIAEDHLRIMRYFRFLARFGEHDVDQDAFDACQKAAQELSKLSRERVADELMKLLSTADPIYAVQQMIETGIFSHIVAGIDPEAGQLLAGLILREEAHDIDPNPVRRLVALLPKDTNKAVEIAKSLRMSKKLQKALETRVSTLENIRALAYWHGIEAARDIALLFAEDDALSDMLDQIRDWQPPAFPITGGDLIAMGMEPGPKISEILARVEQAWIEEGFPEEKRARDLAQNLAREFIAPKD